MSIEDLDKMIHKANWYSFLQYKFEQQCRRDNDPDVINHIKARMKYNRIVERLETYKKQLLHL